MMCVLNAALPLCGILNSRVAAMVYLLRSTALKYAGRAPAESLGLAAPQHSKGPNTCFFAGAASADR
jgi:hypothetical protein